MNHTPNQAANDVLDGVVERTVFHNEENGFCIFKAKVKGEKELVSIVGTILTISPGEYFDAEGTWVHDKQFGRQFRALTIKTTPPTTNDGLKKYLSSGLIRGIREATAKKLIQAFGTRIFHVLDHKPELLTSVAKIPEKQSHRILVSWAEHRSLRRLFEFVSQHGITPSQSMKIHRKYGDEAIAQIQTNPYGLVTNIDGIGFATADRIAQSLGFNHHSVERAQAGIHYILEENTNNAGSCGTPETDLLEAAQELLGVSLELVQEAMILEMAASRISKDHIEEGTDRVPCIFPSWLYHSEKGIAHRLQNLIEGQVPWAQLNIEESLESLKKKYKIMLSATQEEAFRQALCSKVMIVTGGPGVGKTTLMRSILLALSDQPEIKVGLCAPTGRAAKRLSEVTGKNAKTIHRLLELLPGDGFQRDSDKPLEIDFLVVDEFSMVDVPLFYALLKAIPPHAALLIVGDPDQLPSVGPGQVLCDLIASEFIPSVHLMEVFRQAASSRIISIAHNINEGIVPQIQGLGKESDFFFIETETAEEALEQIIDIVTRRLPTHMKLCPFSDIQVLSPMTKGAVGTRSLNGHLQNILNKPREESLKRNGMIFSVGDKVMQTKNNYEHEVYNGDIGLIHAINKEDESIVIYFDQRKIVYDFSELEDLTLSYAITIHKSQGSEYPAIVVPVCTEHYNMMQRNLIYTGITRGKSLVVLVGQKRALVTAVRNTRSRKRWSMLAQRLRP